MLKLSGTIPVRYQKAEYNIPVIFWIPHTYPEKAPIMFVAPTAGLHRTPEDVRQHQPLSAQ